MQDACHECTEVPSYRPELAIAQPLDDCVPTAWVASIQVTARSLQRGAFADSRQIDSAGDRSVVAFLRPTPSQGQLRAGPAHAAAGRPPWLDPGLPSTKPAFTESHLLVNQGLPGLMSSMNVHSSSDPALLPTNLHNICITCHARHWMDAPFIIDPHSSPVRLSGRHHSKVIGTSNP